MLGNRKDNLRLVSLSYNTTNLFQSLSIACAQTLPKLNSRREYQLYIGCWKLFEILTMRFFRELEQKVLWESPKQAVPCAFSCLECTISKAQFFNKSVSKRKDWRRYISYHAPLWLIISIMLSGWQRTAEMRTMVVLPLALLIMTGPTLICISLLSRTNPQFSHICHVMTFNTRYQIILQCFYREFWNEWMNEWMNKLYQGLTMASCFLFLPHKAYLLKSQHIA